MKRFDKDVDIDEKIIELKLAMKNYINNIRLYKIYSVAFILTIIIKKYINIVFMLVNILISINFLYL